MNDGHSGASDSGRDAASGRLDREGAVALGLWRLHRQLAHDLRSPLNSISLHVALLGRAARGDLAGIDDPQAKQVGWLRTIEKDLACMTAGLDLWSNLLAGDGGIPEALDLRGVVRELGAALAPLARRRRLELEVRLPDGEVLVEAAKRELIRLLASLAGASMEVLDDGARLRLELTSDGATATVTAVAEQASEAPGEPPLAPAVIRALAGAFEAMGGCLEPAGGAGWRAGWPVYQPETEERRADD